METDSYSFTAIGLRYALMFYIIPGFIIVLLPVIMSVSDAVDGGRFLLIPTAPLFAAIFLFKYFKMLLSPFEHGVDNGQNGFAKFGDPIF